MNIENPPLICDRCRPELIPENGDFYVVNIEAVADPSPPVFDEVHLDKVPRKEIERLIDEARGLAPVLQSVDRESGPVNRGTMRQNWVD